MTIALIKSVAALAYGLLVVPYPDTQLVPGGTVCYYHTEKACLKAQATVIHDNRHQIAFCFRNLDALTLPVKSGCLWPGVAAPRRISKCVVTQ